MIDEMHSKPLITVITVVFNSENELEDTILSVINQSYENIEYIIVDGGSRDGSVGIIKRYQNRISQWISEPDNGIYDAMNKSLKIATGDFLIFMNSGDSFYSPNTISNLLKNIAEPDAIYYGNAIYTDKINYKTQKRGGYFSKYRLAKVNLCHQTIFYPRSVYKKNKYELKYKLYADWAYNIKLFSKNRFVYSDLDIVFFDASGQSAQSEDLLFKKKRLYFVYKFLGVDAILYLMFNKIRNVVLGIFNKSSKV